MLARHDIEKFYNRFSEDSKQEHNLDVDLYEKELNDRVAEVLKDKNFLEDNKNVTFGIYKFIPTNQTKEDIYILSFPTSKDNYYIYNIFASDLNYRAFKYMYVNPIDVGVIFIDKASVCKVKEKISNRVLLIERWYKKKFDLKKFEKYINILDIKEDVKLSLIADVDELFEVKFEYNPAIINQIKKIRSKYRHYVEISKSYYIYISKLNIFKALLENIDINVSLLGYETICFAAKNRGIEIEPVKTKDLKRFINITDKKNEVVLKFDYYEPLIVELKKIPSKLRSYSPELGWTFKKQSINELLNSIKEIGIDREFDFSELERIKNEYDSRAIEVNIKGIKRGYFEIECKEKNNAYYELLKQFNCLGTNKFYASHKELRSLLSGDRESIVLSEEDINKLNKEVASSFENIELKKININNLDRKPMKHQIKILDKMLELKNFILADSMGLGKTFEAIMYGMSIPMKKLIICPATLLYNWKTEILKTKSDEKVLVMDSRIHKNKMINFDGEYDWIIINYDILDKYYDSICNDNFGVCILDEAHYIKSINSSGLPATKRARYTLKIAEKIPFKVAITGTPINNNAKDCWNLLKFINSKETIYDFKDFKKYFKNENIKLLHELLNKNMIRRLKEDVLELPPITRTFIPTEISIDKFNKKLEDYLCENKKTYNVFIAYLNSLRYILALEKVRETIKLAERLLKENSKIVIFTNYKEPLELIKDHFKDSVYIDGSVPLNKREEIVREFQEGSSKVFVGNLKAAGTGITLTSAQAVIFNDFDYIPSSHLQAEERIHRISQDKECKIYYNYSKDAIIDKFMADKLELKFNLISKIVDNKDNEFISNGDLDYSDNMVQELFKVITNTYKV